MISRPGRLVRHHPIPAVVCDVPTQLKVTPSKFNRAPAVLKVFFGAILKSVAFLALVMTFI